MLDLGERSLEKKWKGKGRGNKSDGEDGKRK